MNNSSYPDRNSDAGMPTAVNEKTRPLEYASNELEVAVTRLETSLGRLLSRLSPLIPSVPQGSSDSKTSEVSRGSSQLVSILVIQIDRIKNMRDIINLQTDLIEI